jgi:hypothetical protein
MNIALAFVNFVCALVFAIIFFAVAIAWLGWPFVILMLVLLSAGTGLFWLSQPKCPKCNARGTLRWLYSRIDGGPDLRYRNNRTICFKCDGQ